MSEQRIERDQASEEADVQARIQEARLAVEDLDNGQDFMLPTSEMLGSITFWTEVGNKLEDKWGDIPVVQEIRRCVDVWDNGGAVRTETLEHVRNLINQAELEAKDVA